MGLYQNNGTYNGYKKNHKEREKTDFYATPSEEVYNILSILNYDFSNKTILEPCCGQGDMLLGLINYINDKKYKNVTIIAVDFIERDIRTLPVNNNINIKIKMGIDFLENNDFDDLYKNIDFIIMNPPYSTIELFVNRALEITPNIIMLARTQFIEGEKRYENIFIKNPFNILYQYVDRIKCYKNGDFNVKGSSAQAYGWFIWSSKEKEDKIVINWIRRYNK